MEYERYVKWIEKLEKLSATEINRVLCCDEEDIQALSACYKEA